MVRDYLDAQTLELIHRYRKENVQETCPGVEFVPSEDILTEWEDAKRQYLFCAFGNELIKTKQVTYQMNTGTLEDKMYFAMRTNEGYNINDPDEVQREVKSGKVFVDAYTEYINNHYNFPHGTWVGTEEEWREKRALYYDFMDMLSESWLVHNSYAGYPHTIPLSEGHNLRMTVGMKVTRILGKLAEAWNLPGFEDFRLRHSQVLNQKTLTGELCLSIHPLDYMTMSDNESGWDSCMSWRETGDYRQGTVEMMNSPMVVVGYLKSNKDMNLFWDSDKETWNNKKWRCLFVVNKDVITAVKDYPYHNKDLEKECVDWLKQLVKNACNWDYTKTETYQYNNEGCVFPDRTEHIRFWTNKMYNDFGCGYEHIGATRIDLETNPKFPMTINYSGYSQCMVCGSTDLDGMETHYLSCENCSNIAHCNCCGERIYDDDICWVDGVAYCYSCYEENFFWCDMCRDTAPIDDGYTIFMVPRREDGLHYDPTTYQVNYFHICEDPECYRRFKEKFLKDGAKLHSSDELSCDHLYFYEDELRDTEDAKNYWYPWDWRTGEGDRNWYYKVYEEVETVPAGNIEYLD